MIEIVKDKDFIEDIGKYDAMILGVNINCNMYNGVNRLISLDYHYVLDANMKTKYGDPNKLGTILECKSDEEPTFTLAFICKFNSRPEVKDYLSYESLENCLKLIDVKYKGKNIAAPILGSSRFDGNGDKEVILDIFNRTIKRANLTLYDFHDLSRAEMSLECAKREIAVKNVDRGEYIRMVKERKEKAEERFRKNGHARY